MLAADHNERALEITIFYVSFADLLRHAVRSTEVLEKYIM